MAFKLRYSQFNSMDMRNTVREDYQLRIDDCTQNLEEISNKIKKIVWLRVITFIAAVILVFFAFKFQVAIGFIVLIVGLFSFLLLIKKHEALKHERDHIKALVNINKEELKRLTLDFTDFDEGLEFADAEHPYTSDMDVFGKNSLFQYLNRSATSLGKVRLAEWLKQRSFKSEIIERQQAVLELSKLFEWRQDFEATSRVEKESSKDYEAILAWLNEDNVFLGKSFFKILIWVSPAILFLLIILAFFVIPASIPIAYGVIQLGMVVPT